MLLDDDLAAVPDGRVVQGIDPTGSYAVVLDTAADQICAAALPELTDDLACTPASTLTAGNIAWGPDGRHVAVTTGNVLDGSDLGVVVLDLDDGSATSLADGGAVQLWPVVVGDQLVVHRLLEGPVVEAWSVPLDDPGAEPALLEGDPLDPMAVGGPWPLADGWLAVDADGRPDVRRLQLADGTISDRGLVVRRETVALALRGAADADGLGAVVVAASDEALVLLVLDLRVDEREVVESHVVVVHREDGAVEPVPLGADGTVPTEDQVLRTDVVGFPVATLSPDGTRVAVLVATDVGLGGTLRLLVADVDDPAGTVTEVVGDLTARGFGPSESFGLGRAPQGLVWTDDDRLVTVTGGSSPSVGVLTIGTG